MKAVRRHQDICSLDEITKPDPRPGETLVRVVLAGVCRTDVYAGRGLLPVAAPVVLGHEFCGEVEKSARFPIGTYVTAAPFFDCGECVPCRQQGQRTCVDQKMVGLQRDGVFAEFVAIPDALLYAVPDSIDPRRAAYVEPVAAALAPIEAGLDRRKRGYILGDGRIAELTLCLFRACGFEDVRLGDGSELTSGSLDWIVEARADEETLSIAVDRLCVGGTLILKSRPSGPVPFDVSLAVKRSLTIRAVHYGSFDRAIELLSTSLDVDFIFGALHQLDEFEAVFANADHETRKVFFEIGAW